MASHHLILQMLRSPSSIGAVAPSSARLAQAMAQASAKATHVVELGAGTGPVTWALLDYHPPERLIVVEMQPKLAARLGEKFPGVDVRGDTAAAVLTDLYFQHPVAIVSGLPFRSLSPIARAATIESVLNFMRRHPNCWMVQFTYQPRAPFDVTAEFCWKRIATVWRNLPPAGVWVLRRCGTPVCELAKRKATRVSGSP